MNENESDKKAFEQAKPKKPIGCFTFFAILVGTVFLFNSCSAILNYFKIMSEPPKNIYTVDEIGDMKRIATFRLFADHYQFFFCDPDRANFDSLFNDVAHQTQIDNERGWIRTDSAVVLFTFASVRDHRVDIFVGNEYDGHAEARQVLIFPFHLSHGQMDVMGLMDLSGDRIQVPPGDYSVYVRLFNPGKATERHIDSDEDFLARDDMERYEIVLVPGKPDKEGVIFGPEKRSDVEREIHTPHPNPLPGGEGNAK